MSWSSKIAALIWPGKFSVNAAYANLLNDSINALFWCTISITLGWLRFVYYECELTIFNSNLLQNEWNMKIKWCAYHFGSSCTLGAWYQSTISNLQHINFSLEHNFKIFGYEISDAWLTWKTSSTSSSGWKSFYICSCSLHLKNDA